MTKEEIIKTICVNCKGYKGTGGKCYFGFYCSTVQRAELERQLTNNS